MSLAIDNRNSNKKVSNKNNFYKAEEYHQNYFNKNPNSAYCKIIIIPKLELIKKNIFVK